MADTSRYQALAEQAKQLGINDTAGFTAEALAALIGSSLELKEANQTIQSLQIELKGLKLSHSQRKPAKALAFSVLVLSIILIGGSLCLNLHTNLSDEVTIEIIQGTFWLVLSALAIFFFAFYGEILREMLRVVLRALPGSE